MSLVTDKCLLLGFKLFSVEINLTSYFKDLTVPLSSIENIGRLNLYSFYVEKSRVENKLQYQYLILYVYI